MDCTRSVGRWSAGLLAFAGVAAHAEMFLVPPAGVDLVGLEESTVAQFEDTLPDIARRYGLGYEEIAVANPGTDPWVPGWARRSACRPSTFCRLALATVS